MQMLTPFLSLLTLHLFQTFSRLGRKNFGSPLQLSLAVKRFLLFNVSVYQKRERKIIFFLFFFFFLFTLILFLSFFFFLFLIHNSCPRSLLPCFSRRRSQILVSSIKNNNIKMKSYLI